MDALWGEREPLPPGPPGGTPAARGLVPQFTGRRRRPPDSVATKGVAVGWRRPKSGGAEMPEFSQHRSHPRPMYRNCRQGAFEPSLVESISPEVALIVPLSALTPKAHPIGYLPFITKRCGILVFSFFFLEYSKNERLYLGKFQWDRACVLGRDGAARARVGSPWAWRDHREGLGTRGHWRFWGETQARVTAELPKPLVLVLRPGVLCCL